MDTRTAIANLKRCGTAQNRKVYARHGIGEKMFGVSFANLKALAKQIGKDHELARKLWADGNHDARVLATMIADPNGVSAADIKSWLKDLDNYVITDAVGGLVSKTKYAQARMEQWTKSNKEWTARAGWHILAHLAMSEEKRSDAYFTAWLRDIEKNIHKRPNLARYAMNNALIAIGLRNPALRAKAIAAAKRIGKVEVDHGNTDCKTPDAVEYIHRAMSRKPRRKK